MLMVAHKTGGQILWGDGEPQAPNIMKMMPPRDRAHPNEKPLRLMEEIVQRHSNADCTILDPFMGSGTTLVACQRLGRQGIGIELQARHFDTACRRVRAALGRPPLFTPEPQKPKQEVLF